LILLCNNPSTRSVATSPSYSRPASLIFLSKHAGIDTIFWGLKLSTTWTVGTAGTFWTGWLLSR